MQLGAPDAGVGGAGGEVRQAGSAKRPILVDSDVDTDDDSGECGGEPNGGFTVGPALPAQLDPAAGPPTSRGENDPDGCPHQPVGRSGAPKDGIAEQEW